MKLSGKKIQGANEEILVLPRSTGEDIVFRARAILDMSEFERLCPEPLPAMIMRKGGKRIADLEDKKYKKLMTEHNTKRIAFIIIKSLEATEQLEWETVSILDNSTWLNYAQELKDSGFSQVEINRITNCVFIANSLNEEKLQEARDNFLAGQAHQNGSLSSPEEELPISPSGEHVSDSD